MPGALRSYGVRDVERLLHLSRSSIRSLVASGFVTPTRGSRGAWRFSFQDLIVLRTARGLSDANVSPRRILCSMRELRRMLPNAMPLSGLSIAAIADRVTVRQGANRWQADSGQYLLAFDGDPAKGVLTVLECRAPEPEPRTAQTWFARAVMLEPQDVAAALAAYERAIEIDRTHLDAHINLGRLLHEAGRRVQAEGVYLNGRRVCGDNPLLLFNLGVLLEDMKRWPAAMDAYTAAVRADPTFAHGYFNLALLCEKLCRPRDAIRHMARYRLLTADRPP